MTKEKPHEFRIRMSPELKAIIEEAKGAKSINSQINDWLWRQAKPDEAERIVGALRPILDRLDDEDRKRFADLAVEAISLLANAPPHRKRR